MAAIQFSCPWLKGHLGLSYRTLAGWKRLHPSKPHPPLSWELATVIALSFCSQKRWGMALGLLLSFDCYLRVKEMTGIRRSDVADIGDPRIPSSRSMMIRLRHTKTGNNQWVTIRNGLVVKLLRRWLKSAGSSDRLFDFSDSVYRYHLKKTCKVLGLGSNYVPHSARHGGATHDHILGMPLEDILFRGRWASAVSTRRYIQMGQALLLKTAVPIEVERLFEVAPFWIEKLFTLPQNH